MSDKTFAPASSARRALCSAFALASFPASSLAQLRVEITGVGSQQFPISIANFARNGQAPAEIDSIIRADLARSGLFRIVDAGG
ncbi:MAG: Tol-Pal system protein TolB, partial [Burkholderiaceae bacterium]|nr:Tol-Pal system protein TolB [Burkholderiaceae bacterium]